jgi:hypothetical protein
LSITPGRRWAVRAGVCLSVAAAASAIAISVHSAYATPTPAVSPRATSHVAPVAAAPAPAQSAPLTAVPSPAAPSPAAPSPAASSLSPAHPVLPNETAAQPDYAVAATTAHAVPVGDTTTISFVVTNHGAGATQPGFFIGAGEGATIVSAPAGCQQLPDLDTGGAPVPAPGELTFDATYNCPMAHLRAGESVTVTMRVQLTVADPTYVFVGAGDYSDAVHEPDYANNTVLIHISPDFG